MSSAYSQKCGGFRDEGISSVVNSLPNLGVDKVHVFRSIVSVIKRGLSDKIPQVYVFLNLIHSYNAHSAFASGTIPRCACCGRRHGRCGAVGCCSCREAAGQLNDYACIFPRFLQCCTVGTLVEPVAGRQHAHEQGHERRAARAGCQQERGMRSRCSSILLLPPCVLCLTL